MLKVQHEGQLNSCVLIEFFLREYAARKFLLDTGNKIIDIENFSSCLITIIRYVVENIFEHEETIECNGEVVKFHDIVQSRKIYEILNAHRSKIAIVINSIIAIYHNSVTDNHRYVIPIAEDFSVYKNKIHDAIASCRLELKFVRDTCIEYGYYPLDLLCMRGFHESARRLAASPAYSVNPFVRIPKNYQSYVYINYILDTGESFFEEELPEAYYFYIKIENYEDVKTTISAVKKSLSRMKKRNDKHSIIVHNNSTMQLCIRIEKNEFDKRDCVKRVKGALLNAVASVKGCDVMDLNLLRDALWHVLEGKNKKISYFNRLVGLHLWDCVFIQKKKVGSAIEDLLNSPEFAGMYRKHHGKEEYFEVEPANLQREYKLACACVESISILPHASRTR